MGCGRRPVKIPVLLFFNLSISLHIKHLVLPVPLPNWVDYGCDAEYLDKCFPQLETITFLLPSEGRYRNNQDEKEDEDEWFWNQFTEVYKEDGSVNFNNCGIEAVLHVLYVLRTHENFLYTAKHHPDWKLPVPSFRPRLHLMEQEGIIDVPLIESGGTLTKKHQNT